MQTKVAAEIQNFEPTDFISKKEAKRMDKYTQYAIAATQIAMEQAAINVEKVNKGAWELLLVPA